MSRNWLINNAEQPKSSEQPRSSGWKTAGNALSILGATMRDTSHGLRGERSSYLSDYMSQVREMEEDALKKKIDADMLGIYGEDGLPGAVEYASKNPSKYALANVQQMATLDKTMKSLEPQKSNTLFDMYRGASDDSIHDFMSPKNKDKEIIPGKRQGGLFGMGYGPGSSRAETSTASPATVQAIKDIRTIEDIEELVANRDEYMAAGVDVDAVIDYYRKDKK